MIGTTKLRTYTKPKPETRRKRKRKRRTTSNRLGPIPEILQEDLFDANDSIRSDIWQDSFDKFVGSRTPLRKDNLIKKVVRAEYNANSSVENVDDSFIEPKRGTSDKERLKVATISTPQRLTPERDLFSMISPIVPSSSQLGISNTRDENDTGLNTQTDHLSQLTDDFHLISTNETVRTGSARGYNSSSNSTSTRIFAGQNIEIQELPERGKKRKPQRGNNRVQTRRGQRRETDKDLQLLARKVVEHVRTKWDDIELPNAEEVQDCTGADCCGLLNVDYRTLLEQEQPKYSIRNKWKQKIQEYKNDDSKKRPKCKDYLRIETGTPNETEEPQLCYDEEHLRRGIEFFEKLNKTNNRKKTQQTSKEKPLRTANKNVNTSEKSLPTFLIEDTDHEIGMSTMTPSPSIHTTTNLELDNGTERCIDKTIESLNSLVRTTASGLSSNMGRKGISVGASFDTSSSLNSGSNSLESLSKNSESLVEQSNSTNWIDQRTSTLSIPLLSLPGSSRRVLRSAPQNSSLRSMNLSRGLRHSSSDRTRITKSCLLEVNHEGGVTNNYALPSCTPVCETDASLSMTPSPSVDPTTNFELDNETERCINRNLENLKCLARKMASNTGRKPIIVGASFDTTSSLNSGSNSLESLSKNSESLVEQSNSTNWIDQRTSTLSIPLLDPMLSLPGSLRHVDRSTPQNSSLRSMNLGKGLRHSSSDSTPITKSCFLEMNHEGGVTNNYALTPVSETIKSIHQNQSNELNSISREHHVSTFRHTNDSLQFESSSAIIEKPKRPAKRAIKKRNSNVASQTTRYNLRNRKEGLKTTPTPSDATSDLRDFKCPSTDTDITEMNADENEQRVEVQNNPLRKSNSKVSLKRPKALPRPMRYNLRRRNISLEVNPIPNTSDTVSDLHSVRIPSTEFENDKRNEILAIDGNNVNVFNSNTLKAKFKLRKLQIRLRRLQASKLNLKTVSSIPSEETEKSMQNLSDCDMESVSSKTSIFDLTEELSPNPEHVPPPDQMVNHSAPISLDEENVLTSKTVQSVCDNQEVCTAKHVTQRIAEETSQACEVNPRHIEVEVLVQNVAPPDAVGSESNEPDAVANPPVPPEQRISKNSNVERVSSNTAMFERTEEAAQASGKNPVHVEVEVLVRNVAPTDATDSDSDANSSPISLDEITVPLDISNKAACFEQVLKDARELSIRCRKEAALALQNSVKRRLDLMNTQNSTKTGDSNLDGTIDKESFFNTISERTTNLAVTQSSLGRSYVGRSVSGHNLLPSGTSGTSRTSRNQRQSCLIESNSSNPPLIELKGGKWRRKLSSIRKSRDSSSRHSKQFDNVSRGSAGVPSSARKVTAKQASKNLELSGLMEASREFSLLIEPTDDETPKLLSSALLDNPSLEKRLQKSLQLIETTTKPTAATRNPVATAEFKRLQIEENISRFNESTGERRRTYQQQLSTPYFNRETSVLHQLSSRRRRTSFIEDTQISGRNPFNQLGLVPTNETSLHAQHHLSTRDVVLRRCGQSEPIDFVSIYSEEDLQNCRKIGEGVYGEVFMNKSHQSGEAVVLKIIPIEGSIEVNGEPQKKFDEILSEIIIAMELSKLRNDREYMTSGFVEVKNVRCVQGRYPEYLIDLWELYRDNYGTENDHPEIFTDDQLFIVLELANGGQDLEAFTFHNAMQSYSAFLQTAITLAVAENKFQFEHRDLHWGNILLKPTDEKIVKYIFKGNEIKIPTHGVKVTIIDYTLSRMIFDTCCLFNDLSNDDELFSAGGDYQFDIYRLMRQRLENNWEVFEPYTNVLWLHYTVDKMISGARYQNTKTKKHRTAMNDIMKLRDELLDFKSASDYIESLY